MKFLEKIPYFLLVPVAVMLALAPFSLQPHLWQKLIMLTEGTLVRPVDILDLLLHATPLVLLVLKLIITGKN